jgi:hypothetical protein
MRVIYSPKQLPRPADLLADEAQLSLVYSLNIDMESSDALTHCLRCMKRDKISTDRAVEASDGDGASERYTDSNEVYIRT